MTIFVGGFNSFFVFCITNVAKQTKFFFMFVNFDDENIVVSQNLRVASSSLNGVTVFSADGKYPIVHRTQRTKTKHCFFSSQHALN